MYPERDDVLIVRRGLIENAARQVQETWDVQTVSGESLAVECPTRGRAEQEARRIAQHRQVSVFYEHDPSSPDSILAFVISYRVSDATAVS